MIKYTIVGSDSFIATKFYNSIEYKKENIKLYSIKSSNKSGEIIKDLFKVNSDDLLHTNVVLNFAAIVHQPKVKDEALYKEINTDLPVKLATEAKKAGVRHFIQMSTIAVYGTANNINATTNEDPITLYGKSKLNADRKLLALQDERFKVTIVRPPLVYGGGKAPGNLSRLIKISKFKLPLPFKGADNLKYFIHVNNLVQVLNIIADDGLNGVVLPTDKQPISAEGLVKLISRYLDQKCRIFKLPVMVKKIFLSLRPNLFYKLYGELHITCNLGNNLYTPIYSIEDGIKEMVS